MLREKDKLEINNVTQIAFHFFFFYFFVFCRSKLMHNVLQLGCGGLKKPKTFG
jgi:hypothetical protein